MIQVIGMFQHYAVKKEDGKKTDALSAEGKERAIQNGTIYPSLFSSIDDKFDLVLNHSNTNRTFESVQAELQGIPGYNKSQINCNVLDLLNIPVKVSPEIRDIPDLTERLEKLFKNYSNHFINSAMLNAKRIFDAIASFYERGDSNISLPVNLLSLNFSHDLVVKGTYLVLNGKKVSPQSLIETGFSYGDGFIFRQYLESNQIDLFEKDSIGVFLTRKGNYAISEISEKVKESADLNEYRF